VVAATREEVWAILDAVTDPEIPAIAITDLGIVRDVRWHGEELEVVLTPTYSGCPATRVIRNDVERTLRNHGFERLRITTQLSPAWTTDWITERGRERLRAFGITPPSNAVGVTLTVLGSCHPECPRCHSVRTTELSHFGSTPCKALYRCDVCGEPFDYFKPF
jgi:ring-1,2-phenylacetyl-CoA epoxidase subunit PaaD